MPTTPSGRARKTILRALVAICLFGALASCGTVKYYTQAVSGQMEIWRKSHPIDQVLKKSDTKPKLRQRLELVQQLRDFATNHLHLPGGDTYHHYADLGRDYVVWVVYAAPEFDIEAKGWWYPIVGNLKYRGFFSEKDAKTLAAKLKAEDYDVLVGGVEAYSTLGWFDDPVLNTFLRREEADLAELLFHELTHIRLFIPGDTEFNEALATAVGQEGARRWLRSQKKMSDLTEYDDALKKDAEIIHMLTAKRPELQKLYEANRKLPVEQQRGAKKAAMEAIKNDYLRIRAGWAGDSRYDKMFKVPMNNARLCTLSTYYDLVPAFEKLIRECKGDLDAFFARAETFKRMDHAARRKALGASPLATSDTFRNE
ncbi:MAG: aminopeptidase [Verrucomicrobiaceae bacterium]|nr:aminopeptidase [Verrucomicrobiaceae bacterium]